MVQWCANVLCAFRAAHLLVLQCCILCRTLFDTCVSIDLRTSLFWMWNDSWILLSMEQIYGSWSSVSRKVVVSSSTQMLYAHSASHIKNLPFESHNFVSHSILLNLHISAQLIKSFPTVLSPWSCIEEKVFFPLTRMLYARQASHIENPCCKSCYVL